MAGNTIDAKLKIAADFAEAVQQLQRLRAEMKGAKADASAIGTGSGSGAAATTQAQKESTSAARTAAAERTRLAREASEAEKLAAREAAAEERRRRQEEVDAARKAAREKRRLAAETAAAEQAAAKATRQAQARSAQLAPQVTDIVTGLAGGQNPLLVAIQQGGQLRDIFGGTGNAVRALMGLFTPLRIAIGGALGVATLFGKAFFDAKGDVDELNRSIAVTGNTAATTGGQLNAQARQIAEAQRVSVASVREVIAELARSGQFSSATMGTATRAAAAFGKASGQSALEAQKIFDGMASGVATWAAKVNQQYNFITAAQYERIRALEAEGRQQEAMRVALENFAATMEQRVTPSTNALERAWQGVGRAISGAWDSFKRTFEDETPEDRIAVMVGRLEELRRIESARAGLPAAERERRGSVSPAIAKLEEEIAAQRRLMAADAKRREERAAAARAENEEIKRSSKEFQDALASVDAAGAQKRLATELAALNQRKAAIELAHSQGLMSELEYSLQLNAIEQRRLQAQAANLQRQIEIEQGRKVGSESEGLARDARVQALQAQLIDLRSQISQAASNAQKLVSDEGLKDAREKANAWEAIWRQSFNAIQQLRQRNASDRAAVGAESADPAARAEAAADVAVAALREQVKQAEEGLAIQLKLNIPENMKESLRRQVEQLKAELEQAETTTRRKTSLESLRDQAAQLQAELNQRLGEIDQALANGTLTSADAERQAIALRAEAIPQLERILALQRAIAATPAEKKQVSQSAAEIDRLKAQALEVEVVMRTSVRDSFAQTFTDFVTGAKSAGEAMRDFVKGVAQAMLQLIARRLGEQLVNSLFGAQGSGGTTSTGGWAQFIASFFHGGGVVGGVQSMTRAVSPMLFATAARYHSGGIAGLAPDEVPAVLRKGEEVLTESDPRHRANGGAGGSAIGNLNIEVNVSGAGASNTEQQQLGDKLGRAIRATVYQVLGEEMRPGGSLAGRS